MSLQQDAHTMGSKESATAFPRDRVLPRAFSHRFFSLPQIIPKLQSSFTLTYIYIPAIFKTTNGISRHLLSEDKYPLRKLDFPLAWLTRCLLDGSRDKRLLCRGSSSTPILEPILKKSSLLFYSGEITYFHCIRGIFLCFFFYLPHSGKGGDFRNLILRASQSSACSGEGSKEVVNLETNLIKSEQSQIQMKCQERPSRPCYAQSYSIPQQ